MGVGVDVDVRVGLGMCLTMRTALLAVETVCAAALVTAQRCVRLGETYVIVYHMPVRDTICGLEVLCISMFRLDVQQGVAVAAATGCVVVSVITVIWSPVVKVVSVLPRIASFSRVAWGLTAVGVRKGEGQGLVHMVCRIVGWVSAFCCVCVGSLLTPCVCACAPLIHLRIYAV